MRTLVRLSAVFIVLMLAGELFARALLTLPVTTTADPELGWVHKPYSSVLHSSEGWAVNQMNSLGLNDADPVLNSGKIPIVVLGDSVTESLHVPRSENFTSLAEVTAPCMDVFNAGRSGLSPIHYPIVLSRVADHLKPELAVIFVNTGDIADILSAKYELVRDAADNRLTGLRIKANRLSRMRVLLDPVISRSALVTYLLRRARAVKMNKNKNAVVAGSKNTIHEYDQHIHELLVYLFSSMNKEVPVALLFNQSLKYGGHRVATVDEESVRLEGELRRAADAAGVPFLSTEPYMRTSYRESGQPGAGFPNKNILDGHLNRLGHQATALALLDLAASVGLECHHDKKIAGTPARP